MSSILLKNDVLFLTTDPDRKAKLERKLKEYKGRYFYQAPWICPLDTYKLSLLDRLLKRQALDAYEAEREFAKNSWHQPDAFHEAIAIINAYNTGDLGSLRGGTGLK